MLIKLLRSLLLTAAVSGVLAWPVTYIGIGFVSAFCFFTALQFVIFYFYSTNLETKTLETVKKLEIQRDIEFSRQFASVTCPCDNKINSEIPLFMGEENTYECPGCKKNINVDIQLKTYLQTIPVNETPDQIINKAIANVPN
jgi:hypothetical protein